MREVSFSAMLFMGFGGQGATVEKVGDKELVSRAAAGDKEAYRVLVEKYQKKCFAIAFEVTRSQEDAEDVVQEAFVKAYLSLPGFKGDSSFYTWLYRIVYNMAIDVKRRRGRQGGDVVEFDERKTVEEGEGTLLAEERFAGPGEAMARKEQARRIREVLGDLSQEHRAVVMLREIEGLSYDEIARVLRINKGTVMSRLFYARKKLQKALADMAPSPFEGAAADEESAFDHDGETVLNIKPNGAKNGG